MISPYSTPTEGVFYEQQIQNSVFLCYLEPVNSVEDFKSRLREIKASNPNARHACWAYRIGCPGQTTLLSMSDDGEPSGTAGKPMLNILSHSPYGDVMAVVVRNFGGIKLGTGGLVRAYSSSVQMALELVEPKLKQEMQDLSFQIEYFQENLWKQLISKDFELIFFFFFNQKITITIETPLSQVESLQANLLDFFSGKVHLLKKEV